MEEASFYILTVIIMMESLRKIRPMASANTFKYLAKSTKAFGQTTNLTVKENKH